MKVREVLRGLQREGWFQVRCTGTHRQLHHLVYKGTVTVSGIMGREVGRGMLIDMAHQAGMTKAAFLAMCGYVQEGKRSWRRVLLMLLPGRLSALALA